MSTCDYMKKVVTDKYIPQEIAWTHEKASRFWDYFSTNISCQSNYFSKQVGSDLIKLVMRVIPLKGITLDFGCGPGYLIEYLLKNGITVQGLDFSAEAFKSISAKYSMYPLFKGAILAKGIPTPLDDESVHNIFFVETLEHLFPEEIDETISELYRVVKSDGYIIITTRNDEDLDSNKVICPECGCIFHRVQHMTSWKPSDIISLMERRGFQTIMCKAIILRSSSKLNFIRKIKSRIKRYKGPNLIYIGRKIIVE